MSEKVVKTIVVDGINPKNGGVLTTEGKWLSISKFGAKTVDGKDITPSMFQKGNTYQVEVATGKNGAEFISGLVSSQTTQTAAAPVNSGATYSRPKFQKKDSTMSKEDWAKKDHSQLIGGLSHDVAQVFTALLTTGGAVDADAALEKAVALVVQGRALLEEKLGGQ
jgi:hypothetical protein